MNINQKGFSPSYILIGLVVLLVVGGASYSVIKKTTLTSNINSAEESVKNYDLDGFATIDYPCRPKRTQIVELKNVQQADHRCTPKGSNDADYNYYVVSIFTYDSKSSYENLGDKRRSCGFEDKGQFTISGKQFRVCNMFVQDGNPSNMIAAILEYPDRNAQLEIILNEPTYEKALSKLTNFTSTLNLK